MEIFIDLVQKLGFPIFVAAFFMFRLEKKLEMLVLEHRRANVVLALLVKTLSDGSSVPQDVIDDVSGVVDISGVGKGKK